ncbi:MAG: methylenetetrahydrofolate--tRNA-(uracil(54)-C(5))-methyltransferase (FADH(2)-oxidizing) TrmFO [Acholeplasmataceae bacterium]
MVKIIGAGLAGCEAAYYLANQKIDVKLYEMRPKKMTPAHQTGDFAELVCSNSLRSDDIHNAVGLLKREMESFDSLIMKAAHYARVPAGSSLAVDRTLFSGYIKDALSKHPHIDIINEEVTEIDPECYTMIAAGPLASDDLSQSILDLFEAGNLHFYDAVAPIIEGDSIDMSICYLKSRYDKGEAAYINCPMDQNTYDKFYDMLIHAKTAEIKDFEKNVFEGCMPVEVMASRGKETLLFGPLKPVGLEQPNQKRPHAVIQLRQDDAKKTMYNIVGFQTHLTWPEQKKLIQMIPGLENANILRYGVMHKNTYLDSPKIMNQGYQTKKHPKIFFAGQISGVEGYVESAASGLNAAIQMHQYMINQTINPLPETTMMGAMASYISTTNHAFVPMNANLGLLPQLTEKHPKKMRKELYAKRALSDLDHYIKEVYPLGNH